MGVIVDACCLGSVVYFGENPRGPFTIVGQLITSGDLVMVHGGTKYWEEVCACGLEDLLKEWWSAGYIRRVCGMRVDAWEAELIKKTPQKFNDQHLAAIVIVSGAQYVCTAEVENNKYLTSKKYYPKGVTPPLLYRHGGGKTKKGEKLKGTNPKIFNRRWKGFVPKGACDCMYDINRRCTIAELRAAKGIRD